MSYQRIYYSLFVYLNQCTLLIYVPKRTAVETTSSDMFWLPKVRAILYSSTFAPSVWCCCCGCKCYLVMERWIKEAETGGAALHHKLQSGFTSTAVMAYICWVDGLICNECLTTDELCSTLSISKGSLKTVTVELAVPRSVLIGCHK